MAPTPFTGSLSNKRKADLVEIAEALNIYDESKSTIAELKDTINSYLEENEVKLSKSSQFKGLYGRKRNHSDEDSPVSDAKAVAASAVKSGRKSVNKLLDKTIDAASIPLPDSPLVNRITEVANEGLTVALAPTEHIPRDLRIKLRDGSRAVVSYTARGQERVENIVRILQKYLSRPEHLITSSIAIELLFLLSQVLQFYEHTVFFPPVGGTKGDFYALLHSVFGWAPVTTLTVKLPEIRSFFAGDVWSALSWWFFTTVLPPLALSTLISFVPQHERRSGPVTRHHSPSQLPHPTPDPLAFALFRFAALVFALTSAAPASFVEALEASGNTQGRALGAGLVAALTAADKLR